MHVQLSDQEYRQNAYSEIANRREGTVDIGHGNYDVDVYAGSLNVRIERNLGPKIRQRLALQEHQEPKDQATDDGKEHDDI